MTRDVFAVELDRLSKGHDVVLKRLQVDAFYERLQHCHESDWHEAVTDLLCQPKFPFSIDVILGAIEKRADDRRRVANDRLRVQADRFVNGAGAAHAAMHESLEERPELKGIIERLLERKLT